LIARYIKVTAVSICFAEMPAGGGYASYITVLVCIEWGIVMEGTGRHEYTDNRQESASGESSGGLASKEEITHAKPGSSKKHATSKPWYMQPSILISLAALVIALVSAGTSIVQANTAEQQKIASEQQELLTLVTDIANEPGGTAQQSLALQSNPNAVTQATNGAQYAELTDSDEAANLIGLLGGDGVTAEDYYEIAEGLAPSDSYSQALEFLKTAANLPSDPRTHASILRYEAGIYYQLGDNSAAKQLDVIAAQAFNHLPDVTKADQENNVADTEFWDASYQAAVSCSTALAEFRVAANIFAANFTAMFPGTTSEHASATKELQYENCL
jgi:hypothetical protein